MPTTTIRPITPADNESMARIIREVMPSFGACGPGFAINDPEVDHIAESYAGARSAYSVLEFDGRVVGGAGIAPLQGADPSTCELRKMYFLPVARGQGLGERMLHVCLEQARAFHFSTVYLETLTGMDSAIKLYTKVGFRPLCSPMGKTGHFSCDQYYSLSL
jgi:putative acetyltransferase